MRKYTKKEADQNKNDMIEKALAVAEKVGFSSLTRTRVAEACGVSPGLINYRFGTLAAMQRDIVRAAIRKESLAVIAHVIAVGHPLAKKIDPDLRQKAIASMSKA